MRGCVRSCSRRQRRPQHPLQPSAGPAFFACPAVAASACAPATVSPEQLPLHGPVNRLLFFQLLLLLPLPSRIREPLPQLTVAPLLAVSSAQLCLAPGAPRAVCGFLAKFHRFSYLRPRCLPLPRACLASPQPPRGAAPECPCRAVAFTPRPAVRAQSLSRAAGDAEDALL